MSGDDIGAPGTRRPRLGFVSSSVWKWIATPPGPEEPPDPKALADRARREALGPRADLTGRLVGDPPPGRSALEMKIEAERLRALTQQSTEENGDG
jgi:hypothetical protein